MLINFWQRPFPFAKYDLLNQKQKREVINKLIDRELYLEIAKRDGIERDSLFMSEMDKLKENLMLGYMDEKRVEIRIGGSQKGGPPEPTILKKPQRRFPKPAVGKGQNTNFKEPPKGGSLERNFIERGPKRGSKP